jgi:putative Flp pilus-assembly TadE/G-like protein
MKKINQRGQSMVLSIVFLTVLMGMSALVIDVGAWYRAHRSAQATADASALAAAQALPDTQRATALANEYAGKNAGTAPGVVAPQITFSRQGFETDTVQVTVTKPHPGFFSKLFGLASVNVKGRATARAWNVSQVKGVAPITVNYKHPLLNCTRGQHPTCNPNFGSPTTLTLEDIHTSGGKDAAGSFGLINLDQNDPNPGANTLAEWLLHGFPTYLGVGRYESATGASFGNSQFRSALDQQIGHELMFPVYRLIKGPGGNAIYDIIGWVGYKITSYTINGNEGTISGSFTRYVVDGVPSENGGNGGAEGLGVHKIELTN